MFQLSRIGIYNNCEATFSSALKALRAIMNACSKRWHAITDRRTSKWNKQETQFQEEVDRGGRPAFYKPLFYMSKCHRYIYGGHFPSTQISILLTSRQRRLLLLRWQFSFVFNKWTVSGSHSIWNVSPCSWGVCRNAGTPFVTFNWLAVAFLNSAHSVRLGGWTPCRY